ncbi:hypothetical protein Tco_1316698 [Tanacetum coccineum]
MVNLSLKHGLILRTYSKKSLIMASIFGFKSKSFRTMSIPPQGETSIKQPVGDGVDVAVVVLAVAVGGDGGDGIGGSDGVMMIIMGGEGHYLETLEIEYDWWPPRCSKCKIFNHEDEYCPSLKKKAALILLDVMGRICATDSKQKGGNKAAKAKHGFRFSKPKNNLIYRLVSKPITTKKDTSKLSTMIPSISKEVVNEADVQLNVSQQACINDSSCSINENGYFKDHINIGQLRSNIEKRMDDEKVLDIIANNNMNDVVDSGPIVSVASEYALVEVKGNDKGCLWEQFQKAREGSKSKQTSMSDLDESEVEEMCMPGVVLGRSFSDCLEDDLDHYDGYEAQIYDLSEKEQAFCDMYDIRLNSRNRERKDEPEEEETVKPDAAKDNDHNATVKTKEEGMEEDYHWIMSNRLESRKKLSNPMKICNFVGRVRGLKVCLGNFTYECKFVVLEDTNSVIDHYLGEVVFEKPFIRKTGLVYDKEKGTIKFEMNNKKITFKMPYKMERFSHIDFQDIKTDSIPPFVLENDDDHEKAYYSNSLILGPEYKQDESVSKEIRHLMELKSRENIKGGVT